MSKTRSKRRRDKKAREELNREYALCQQYKHKAIKTVEETREQLLPAQDDSTEILPPELSYFMPLRDGRILYCASCKKSRESKNFTSPPKDPDLLVCPCGAVGYSLIVAGEVPLEKEADN